MNGCSAMQAKFSEYLDGRLTGREMQRIAAHLDRVPRVRRRVDWRCAQNQAALASLGPVPEPEDLLLRIRVAVSQRAGAPPQERLCRAVDLAWRNTVGPFLLQAAAGFASAVLLLGTVTVLVGMFTQPEVGAGQGDEPLGDGHRAAAAVSLQRIAAAATKWAPLPARSWSRPMSTVQGEVYDYRIVSGPTDAATRSQVENMLVLSRFEPARFFGQPVRGLAVLSFSGVSVRG